MTPKFDAFISRLLSDIGKESADLTSCDSEHLPSTVAGIKAHMSAVSEIKKLIVEVPSQEMLTEATTASVGRYTARRDSPHFNGDEYHGHSEVEGGYEVSWGVSGKRRHPNKFPAVIPNDSKLAVAKVLRVDPAILEGFVTFDTASSEYVLLIECPNPV